MEFFLTPEFWSALAAIILIDLILAGDNAIVIALAARNLPAHLQKRAVLWGTFGAIAVRAAMTMVVVWLLQIPGLMLLGGLALVWIAWKLVAPGQDKAHDKIKPAQGFWAAMKTIIVADAVMGIDNVLAVAGAAHGSFLLVVLGLLISVPIVIWGSRLILKWIERFPSIIYIGAAVLAWTAAKMISGERVVAEYLATTPVVHGLLYLTVISGVVGLGYLSNRRRLEAAHNV